MKTFKISELKKEIKTNFGSVAKLKKHLVNNAENKYDTLTSEVNIYGCKIAYTSNPNHFAKFYIKIGHVGFTNTLALGYKSLTKSGINRGCGQYFINI